MTIKTIFTAGVAALMLAGVAGVAEAKVRQHPRPFFEFEDYPFGQHCMRFGHQLHCSGPNWGNTYYQDQYFYDDPGYGFSYRLSCGEARDRVRGLGFKKVVSKDCSGKSYSFTGSKHGQRYLVKVNAHTGRVKTYAL